MIKIMGVVGAWLVFAASYHQGLMELLERRSSLRTTLSDNRESDNGNIHSPNVYISKFLWLVPSVKIYWEKKRLRNFSTYNKLTENELGEILRVLDIANSWFYVSFGGLCIAIRDTFDLVEELLPFYLFAILVGVLAVSLITIDIYKVTSFRRNKKITPYKNK
ncbi:hypothetical protein LB941_09455 [Ligilactobacillus sp. WILCCON 0076]|uniref:Uncharacterized protein n=1 Tax=Ligilactobacillus ubinensis TaxID=2876789 RepID=A0A9X2FNP3_9LACO|nr:hypothetical protein [Ligilactobacillus ubinensis]MCP0887556.1 hypothetical protein [Ligilactobacillus ubinensis]